MGQGHRPESKSRALRGQPSLPSPAIALQECGAETEIDEHAVSRALALLARWACRRAGKVLEGGEVVGQNRVTAADIKGYGAQNAEN